MFVTLHTLAFINNSHTGSFEAFAFTNYTRCLIPDSTTICLIPKNNTQYVSWIATEPVFHFIAHGYGIFIKFWFSFESKSGFSAFLKVDYLKANK